MIEDWRDIGPTGIANILKSLRDNLKGVLYFGLNRESKEKLDKEYKELDF